MNLGKISYSIVVILVTVIIISTAVIPIINVAQNQQVTLLNNTSQKYSVNTTDLSIELSYDTDHATINGVDVAEIVSANVSFVFVASDKFIARSSYSNGAYGNWLVMGPALTNSNNALVDAEVIVENGEATISKDETTFTAEITYLLSPNSSGTYGAFAPSSSIPVNVDVGQTMYWIRLEYGTCYLYSGDTLTLDMEFARTGDGLITEGTKELTATLYDDYGTNYYSVTGPTEGNSLMFVPIQYTGISTDNSVMIALLSIIPIVLMLVPVFIVVRLIGNGRD